MSSQRSCLARPHPSSHQGLITLVVSALAVLVLLSAAHADDWDSLGVTIRRELFARNIPSLAVAVAKDGQIVWEEGFGWADRENRVAASEHTMYSLASISKPITATGLMVLVERGLLQLDRPANDFLASARLDARVGDAREATVRTLANHTSGLPLHYQFFYADEPFPIPPRDESIRRYGQLHAPPGERYLYSNFGYGVLDSIIERIGGRSYADFMRQEVFLPLGMTHASVGIPAELAKFQAVRYGPDHRPIPFYDFDHPGASAVYASAHDLVRFGMFHLKQLAEGQQKILSDAAIDEMQRSTADVGGGRGYGVGWSIQPDEHGYATVGHTGGMGGVRTRLTLVPSEKIVVVALCNFGDDLPHAIAGDILAKLLPKYADNLRRARAEERRKRAEPPIPNSFETPAELAGRWLGAVHTHQGERKVRLTVQRDGDVHVRIENQLETLLNEASLKEGELKGVLASDIGTDDAGRRPYHLHLHAKLRGDRMNGSLTAISLPGRRAGNALSYWIDLAKEPQELALFDGRSLGSWKSANTFEFEDGQARVADGQIVLEKGQPASGIVWTGELPRVDYEVSLEARRLEGNDFFCGLTFPIARQHATLIIGGWGGGVTGISNVDGISAVENQTMHFSKFENDRWYAIRLRVTRAAIEAWIDNDQIVDLRTQDRQFAVWWEQEPMRPLGIASWQTKAELRNIRLKRLSEE